jgi:trk system potassium uptake protein TrkA
MNIIILGAGTVGINLAEKLSRDGHNLFLVDTDKYRMRSAEEVLDIKTLVGDGTSVPVLRQAEIDNADLLIAVTSSDAVNILACQLASKLGCKKKVARVRQSEYFHDAAVITPYDMGIDLVIRPEAAAAEKILQLIFHPYAVDMNAFFEGKMEVVGIKVKDSFPVIGKTIGEVQEECKKEFLVVGLMRNQEGVIPIQWDGTIQSEDKIYIAALKEDVTEVVSYLGVEIKESKNVFVYGGTSIAMSLAERLEHTKVQTKILEPTRERSRELAHALQKTLVLQGEGTDSSLLESEGIGEADIFAAVTEDEEANLLSCILAKQLGVSRSISLVAKPDYVPLLSALDVDAVISTRLLTIHRILSFVHKGEVVSVSELSEDKLEAIEFRVTNNAIVLGMELGSQEFKDIFPKDAVIGGVQRDDGSIGVPSRYTMLEEGDKVMIYSSPKAVLELEKIFV